MFPRRFAMLALLALAFLAVSSAFAQGRGAITGTVTATSGGAPISGARVAIATPARAAMTDEKGAFALRGLPDGSYELTVTAMGYAPGRKSVKISAGGTVTADLSLASGPILLSGVTVTGTVAPTDMRKVAATLNTLSSEQVRTSPARDVQDMLREVPGLEMPRTSSTVGGSAQIVSIRGVDEGRTAVLVDGVPINDAWGEWIDWNRVPKSMIDRVEVLEGGGASLYGNGAMGGVISLYTKPASPGSWRAQYEAGSRSSRHAAGSGSLGLGDLMVVTAVGDYGDGGGYRLVAPASAGPVDVVSSSIRRAGNLRVDIAPSTDFAGWANWRLFSDDRKLGTPLSRGLRQNGAADAGVNVRGGDKGAFSARIWDSEMREDQWGTAISTANGVARAIERTTSWAHIPSYDRGLAASWSRANTLGFQSFGAGADYRYYGGFYDEQDYANTAANGPTTHFNSGGTQVLSGAFVSGTLAPASAWTVELSARVDAWGNNDGQATDASGKKTYPNASRSAFSPRIGAKWQATGTFAVHTALYQAFRAPNLAELYRESASSTAISLPNPSLKPEFATGYELGIDWQPVYWAQVKGTIYQTHYSDFNTFVTLSAPGVTPSTRQRQNVTKADGTGGELYVAIRPTSSFTLSASGTYNDTRVGDLGTAAPTPTLFKGARVARVPFSHATVRASYASTDWGTWSLVGRYEGTNTTFGNAFTLPDFGVVDASVTRPVMKGLDAFVGVENIFDRKYWVNASGSAAAPIVSLGMPLTVRAGLEAFRF